MDIVITTGCQNSGWNIVLPILQQSGFELAGVDVNRLLDVYFQEAAGEALQICQPLQPDSSLGGDVAAFLSDTPSSPVLLADSRNIWLLDFWVQQFPQAHFLLFYTRAESALAYALQQGVEPLQFMEYWQAANRQLLQFHRRHRQRTLLFDAESSRLHPQALEVACKRIGLTLKPASNLTAPVITPSALERFLAEYLLSTRPEVRMLQMELEASTQPLGEIVPKIELLPADVIDSFRQVQACQHNIQQQLELAQQNFQQLEASHQETTQENELLLQQIHQVQEELEENFSLKQQLEQTQRQQAIEQQELKAKLEQAQQTLQEQQAANRDVAQENELLLLQLHQVQEELEANFSLKQQLEQTQRQQAIEQQELKVKLEQAEQTLQEQQAVNRNVAQENELLLLQLHQVQEELEHYFLEHQERPDEQQGDFQAKVGETGGQRKRNKISQILSWNISLQPVSMLLKKINQNKERKVIKSQVDWLKASGLFNETWYLSAYPDVGKSGINPVRHYVVHGVTEGRNPSPEFNTRSYLAANPDVAATGINPLIHYGKFGKAEGRPLYRRGNATWK